MWWEKTPEFDPLCSSPSRFRELEGLGERTHLQPDRSSRRLVISWTTGNGSKASRKVEVERRSDWQDSPQIDMGPKNTHPPVHVSYPEALNPSHREEKHSWQMQYLNCSDEIICDAIAVVLVGFFHRKALYFRCGLSLLAKTIRSSLAPLA